MKWARLTGDEGFIQTTHTLNIPSLWFDQTKNKQRERQLQSTSTVIAPCPRPIGVNYENGYLREREFNLRFQFT